MINWTKEGGKAGGNKALAYDLHVAHFKLELMPNHIISQLRNTGIWLTRYMYGFMPLLNLSSNLSKFTEKSDSEFARAAVSTWLVQNSQKIWLDIIKLQNNYWWILPLFSPLLSFGFFVLADFFLSLKFAKYK